MTDASAAAGGAWPCAACGHANPPREGVSGLVCEACGVARAGVLVPPLDLPRRPGLADVPGFWYALGWLTLLALGAALLASGGALAALGLGRHWVVAEMVAAAYAAGSSLLAAVWDRWFNQVELAVPPRAATGEGFTAELRLVPYVRLERVSVSLALVDRYYERAGDAGMELRSRSLGEFRLLDGGTLPGRRLAAFEAGFVAPFPVTRHSDVRAELAADLLGLLGFFVPALRWNARNLREHGGYVVVATVRVGWLPRRLVRRVLVYHVGERLHVG
ncbi:MAG TPA: zinc finger Ran-binding domain-containing protein [Trueperaceae bacterium]